MRTHIKQTLFPTMTTNPRIHLRKVWYPEGRTRTFTVSPSSVTSKQTVPFYPGDAKPFQCQCQVLASEWVKRRMQ